MPDSKYIKEQCTKYLLGHRVDSYLKPAFQELTDSINVSEIFDVYGSGELIEDFEKKIAVILGKEKAVFLPSGIMAQQIALRIWCYQYLHNIKRIQFGGPEFVSSRMLTVKDFENLDDIPAVILIELPYRPLGGDLPSWESLLEIKEWATKNNILMHLDGARLWETKPYYKKDYSEICSIFDSVYVSFYKGLGGITGAILAGTNSFIQTAKVWQKRYGGNLFSLAPYVLSSRLAIQKNLEKMPLFVSKAQEFAKIFNNFPKMRVFPNPPKTNTFFLYVDEKVDVLKKKHLELMKKYKTCLFPYFEDCNIPGFIKIEIDIFENALQIEDELLEKMLIDLFT